MIHNNTNKTSIAIQWKKSKRVYAVMYMMWTGGYKDETMISDDSWFFKLVLKKVHVKLI